MTNLPAHKRKNPPPAKTQSNGITSALIDGITFGVGSSIGNTVINKIFGIFSSENKDKCSEILHNFNECNKNYGNSLNNDSCMDIFSDYEKCKSRY
jgi:hypothetical protein